MAKVNLSVLILCNPYINKNKIPMFCRGLGDIENIYIWDKELCLTFEYEIVGKQIYDSFHTHSLYLNSYINGDKYIVNFKFNDSWKNKINRLVKGDFEWTLNYPIENNYGRILLEKKNSWIEKKKGQKDKYHVGYNDLFSMWLQHYYDLTDNEVCQHMDYFEKNNIEPKIKFEFKKECYEWTEEKEEQFNEFIRKMDNEISGDG